MKIRYVFPLILVISVIFYANALNNGFQYDDQIYIEENTNIKTAGLLDVFLHPSYLFAPGTATGHYRPLVLLTLIINYRLHGLNPVGYHVVNLAFHIGSAMLLYLIIKAMLGSSKQAANVGSSEKVVGSRRNEAESDGSNGFKDLPATSYPLPATFVALTTALIFAIHPFNSEVINYITARSSVMSGFFYLLAFYFWVRYRKVAGNSEQVADIGSSEQVAGSRKNAGELDSRFKDLPATCYLLPATYYYIASLLAFLLGMLSKEVVITLPAAVLLYDLYFIHVNRTDLSGWFKERLRLLLPVIPFVFIVVIPYLIMRVINWGGILTPFKRTPLVQFYTELPVLVKHLKLFILPVGLNIEHYQEIYSTFFVWPIIGSALVLMLFIALMVLLYRSVSLEWRVVSFFMLWFFVVLLPTTVIPLNAIFQENRGYLAMIVFPVFAGVLLTRGKGKGEGVGMVPVAVLVLLLLIYGAGTLYRNHVWTDGISLWSDAVRKSPKASRAYTNLGIEYAKAGRSRMAGKNLHTALRLVNPETRGETANIHYNLGAVYHQMGRLDMAVGEYKMVSDLMPGDFRPYYNMGAIYQQRGEAETAIGAYKEALKRHPSDFRAYHNLGLLYQNQGDIELAVKFYQKALEINPDYARSHLNLGVIYEKKGDTESAIREYIAALKGNPDYLSVYYNLGGLYEREGNIEMAIKTYKEAYRKKPGNSELAERIRSLEDRYSGR